MICLYLFEIMKPLFYSLACAALLSACNRNTTTAAKSEGETTDKAPENGAQFKQGEGISLTEEMKRSLDLKTAEVSEEKVAPTFTTVLHVMPSRQASATTLTVSTGQALEANGWLTAKQAALLKPGMQVEIRGEDHKAPAITGKISRLEKTPYASIGDYEVNVDVPASLHEGARVSATFRAPEGEAVASIPRSALLQTAEGTFAYTTNGKFYMRTPVKVGAMSEDRVEITDGLYAGDEVIVSPVMSLWMAELQVLRGGKACTCGH
jgi:multidrug efflux pump subunit AcrA (membrane-fusion protein)